MDSLERLPWEIVETLPSTDAALIANWESRLDEATGSAGRARALIGRALANYWAAQEGLSEASRAEIARRRQDDVGSALRLASDEHSPDLLAEALLGVLYATWGPDSQPERAKVIAKLAALRASVVDEELRLRILEWIVLNCLDNADMDKANATIEQFAMESADTKLVLFKRREILWRGCIAMLDGRIDESVRINQDAISSTADTAGSPFSFQNVAITVAIERYFRRGLADVIDAIRSIRASSPRVAPNWDTGLAFALSESGELDEAAGLFDGLAAHEFDAVPRDLNWLVTMQLLGLIALTLDDRERGQTILDALRPFARLDATHGSGYASYGPVARVVASLAARLGEQEESEHWFEFVLSTRPPGPWTSLTLLDRASARRDTDPDGSLTDAAVASRALRGLGLTIWAERADSLVEELRLDGFGGPIARLTDGRWTLRHPSGAARVDAGVGASHLVQLLARPGDPINALTLDSRADISLSADATSASTLDPAAREAYRARVEELESLDSPNAVEAEELSFLLRELSGAAHYVSTSPEIERARVRVTKAIRRTIDDISNESTGLGAHLRDSVSTGRRCLYQPPDGAPWDVIA